jgi:serralysin
MTLLNGNPGAHRTDPAADLLTFVPLVTQVVTPVVDSVGGIVTPTPTQPPSSGSTEMWGTDGHDTMWGTAQSDFVRIGAGHDWLSGDGGSDTIFGGDGNDHLYGHSAGGGSDLGDLIHGEGGNDYIKGNAGNDTLMGGEGADRLRGSADNDYVDGGNGNDSVQGNVGNDTVIGGAGNDTVGGGQDNDSVNGGDGNDHLYGGMGYDTFVGGSGADIFHLDAGNAPTLSVPNLLGQHETVEDFTDGLDKIDLQFAVETVQHGAAQSTLAGALVLAEQLLTGQSSSVAAVQVGADTFLFYASGGAVAGNMVEFADVHADLITEADFI